MLMKTLAISLALASIVTAQSPLRVNQEKLLDALIKVESNGNNKAIGDNGKSIGCLQIQRAYWVDATERSGLGGNYRDCFKRSYAKCVVRAYMNRYGKKWWNTLEGFNPEKIARIHNGGPKGHKKKATKAYWQKVRKVLAK